MKYCFIDRYENVEKYLSAELKTMAQQTSDCVEPDKLEDYHKFLQVYADIFSSNVYKSNDYTYHDWKLLIKKERCKKYTRW